MIAPLTLSNYDERVREAKGRSLLDFHAPYCGPCRQMKPVLEEFSRQTGIPVYTVDITEEESIAEAFEVKALPTLVAIEDGDILGQMVGGGNLYRIAQLFK